MGQRTVTGNRESHLFEAARALRSARDGASVWLLSSVSSGDYKVELTYRSTRGGTAMVEAVVAKAKVKKRIGKRSRNTSLTRKSTPAEFSMANREQEHVLNVKLPGTGGETRTVTIGKLPIHPTSRLRFLSRFGSIRIDDIRLVR
ncbi:MAG: hypothetical protein AAF492_06920 [Verrucomicrobiota bacterium]